jgi:hypothetical protein
MTGSDHSDVRLVRCLLPARIYGTSTHDGGTYTFGAVLYGIELGGTGTVLMHSNGSGRTKD